MPRLQDGNGGSHGNPKKSEGSVGVFRFSVCPSGGESRFDSFVITGSMDEHMSWRNGSLDRVFAM